MKEKLKVTTKRVKISERFGRGIRNRIRENSIIKPKINPKVDKERNREINAKVIKRFDFLRT